MLTHSRYGFGLACAAMLTTAALTIDLNASRALAQQTPANGSAENETLYIGVINGDDVYVRCGAGESYYPFYKVHRGDLVKVTGDRFGWSRVAVIGPAFSDAFGYIKHAKNDTSRIRVAPDGHSAATLGRVDLLAPNLDASNQAKDSWKTLVRLEADQTVGVIEMNDDGKEVLYKVTLPATATGWISTQFVPRASAEETEMFKDMLESKASASSANPKKDEHIVSAPKPPSADQPHVPPAGDAGNIPETNPLESSAPTDTVAIAPTSAPASQPEKPREPGLEDLETRFKQLQREPIETAEVMPLRDLYLQLADKHPNDQRIQRYAQTRARQMEIWQELQQKKLQLAGAQERMKMSVDEAAAVKAALERSEEYTAVGRVAASTIYDGTSLPKLFRLQDPATGRTVAYLKPDEDYALANRIDIIVGIVGDKAYDESLRLNMITPRRIDVLSPDKNVAGAEKTEDK